MFFPTERTKHLSRFQLKAQPPSANCFSVPQTLEIQLNLHRSSTVKLWRKSHDWVWKRENRTDGRSQISTVTFSIWALSLLSRFCNFFLTFLAGKWNCLFLTIFSQRRRKRDQFSRGERNIFCSLRVWVWEHLDPLPLKMKGILAHYNFPLFPFSATSVGNKTSDFPPSFLRFPSFFMWELSAFFSLDQSSSAATSFEFPFSLKKMSVSTPAGGGGYNSVQGSCNKSMREWDHTQRWSNSGLSVAKNCDIWQIWRIFTCSYDFLNSK